MSKIPGPRESIQQLMRDLLSQNEGWNDLDLNKRETIIRRMERSCALMAEYKCNEQGIICNWKDIRHLNKYSEECKRILENIDVESEVNKLNGFKIKRTYLVDKLIKGEIDPKDITNLSQHELCPMASQELRDSIYYRNNQVIEHRKSKLQRCRNCDSDMLDVREAQTRALDEASVFKYRCLKCGNNWTD